MKLFATIFAAVLCAVLILAGVQRWSANHDRAVAKWDAEAVVLTEQLREARVGSYNDDSATVSLLLARVNFAALRVENAPSGAMNLSDLRAEMERGMDRVNEWRASRKLAPEYPHRKSVSP
jgi:hypothetical protein